MSTTAITTAYSLLGERVAVRCNGQRLAAWLNEALTPELEVCGPDRRSGQPPVTVEIAAEPWHQMEGTDTVGRAVCFALDQKVAALPVRRASDRTWIQDDHFAVVYELGPRSVKISGFGDRGRMGPAALRVIRELTLAQVAARRSAMVELHAAALMVAGRVALLVGPKGAGKTTTLVRLAAGGRAELVANDRLLVVASGQDGWSAQGVPTLVNVRRPTLARFAHLFGVLPPVDHVIDRTLAELRTRADQNVDESAEHSDLALSPAQLAYVLGARRSGGGPLGAVVAVRVDEHQRAFRCRSLNSAEARAVIDANRFGVTTHPRPATVFETMVGHSPSAPPERVLDSLAREVPVLELTVGSEFLRDPAVAEAVLDALAVVR